jgi:hypothetical protein
LDCHEHHLSKEDLEEAGKEQSQQKVKEKEKDEEVSLYV